MTKLYVQLGRMGDIMSLLPLLYADFQKTGVRSGLMVAKEFASLLLGVGYVEGVIYDGPHYEIAKAVPLAKTIAKEVLCCQVNGPVAEIKKHTYKPAGQERAASSCFQKEQWSVAGRIKEWDDCLPLVFDQRDKKREIELLRKHDLIKRGKQKPLMLIALKSTSSPFPYVDVLRELVTLRFQDKYRILELPQAERIYDLLAIYDRASLLIAVDSAPLHLAWANRLLPVFAIAQDKPMLWNGSAWRPNHLWYCRYQDWPNRALNMLNSIEDLTPKIAKDRLFMHSISNACVIRSAYEDPNPPVNCFNIMLGACGRDSGNTLNDERRHPYLRDVLRMAFQRAFRDDAHIVLTRPGVQVDTLIAADKPLWSYRLVQTPDGLQYSPVVDLFCATRKWWKRVFPEIPDLILGNDYSWSQCLLVLFKQFGASDATGCCSFVKEGK